MKSFATLLLFGLGLVIAAANPAATYRTNDNLFYPANPRFSSPVMTNPVAVGTLTLNGFSLVTSSNVTAIGNTTVATMTNANNVFTGTFSGTADSANALFGASGYAFVPGGANILDDISDNAQFANRVTIPTANITTANLGAVTATNLTDISNAPAIFESNINYSSTTNFASLQGAYLTPGLDHFDGWNSWFINGAYPDFNLVSNIMVKLQANGLQAMGFNRLTTDGGTFTGRTNGIPTWNGVNTNQWPNGWPAAALYMRTNGFRVGVYCNGLIGVGQSGGEQDTWIDGAPDTVANFFLTNGVVFVKCDGLPISSWTNAIVPGTATSMRPLLNPYSQDYLRFANHMRTAPWKVHISTGNNSMSASNFAPEVRWLNSWRNGPSGTYYRAKDGITLNGDITAGRAPIMLWTWVTDNNSMMDQIRPGFTPDFDTAVGQQVDFQRHFDIATFFNATWEIYDGTVNYGFHNFTNELGYQPYRNVRDVWSTPTFCYWTNNCAIYKRPDGNGGYYVLAINENYNVLTNSGDGTTLGLHSIYDRWGILQFTNNWKFGTSPSTNFAYVFTATNFTLDFALMGIGSSNAMLTSLQRPFDKYGSGDNYGPVMTPPTSGKAWGVGSFVDNVYAAGTRLYDIQPVTTFPAQPQSRNIAFESPWYFINTNSSTTREPFFEPMQIYGGSTVYPCFGLYQDVQATWGTCGASAFTVTAGKRGDGFGDGGVCKIYVDGALAFTSVAWSSSLGATNITIPLSPTNQQLSIWCSGYTWFVQPVFVYTNNIGSVSGSYAGDGSQITNVNASALASGTVPSGRISGNYSSAISLTNSANTFNGSYAGDGSSLNQFSYVTFDLPYFLSSQVAGNLETVPSSGQPNGDTGDSAIIGIGLKTNWSNTYTCKASKDLHGYNWFRGTNMVMSFDIYCTNYCVGNIKPNIYIIYPWYYGASNYVSRLVANNVNNWFTNNITNSFFTVNFTNPCNFYANISGGYCNFGNPLPAGISPSNAIAMKMTTFYNSSMASNSCFIVGARVWFQP